VSGALLPIFGGLFPLLQAWQFLPQPNVRPYLNSLRINGAFLLIAGAVQEGRDLEHTGYATSGVLGAAFVR